MFEPFDTLTGPAAPLPRANIDTDLIIRIDRLTSREPSALQRYAFEALRYLDDGGENPDFPFNQDKWRDAPILLAGPNFGCGSSRESAVDALLAMGIRCVVAESFGDIFYANCFQNGLLPIRLVPREVEALMSEAKTSEGTFEIDLKTRSIRTPSGRRLRFPIDDQKREAMLQGLDDIGLTLNDASSISDWQSQDKQQRPWIWAVGE